jgi:hypothetical protein
VTPPEVGARLLSIECPHKTEDEKLLVRGELRNTRGELLTGEESAT